MQDKATKMQDQVNSMVANKEIENKLEALKKFNLMTSETDQQEEQAFKVKRETEIEFRQLNKELEEQFQKNQQLYAQIDQLMKTCQADTSQDAQRTQTRQDSQEEGADEAEEDGSYALEDSQSQQLDDFSSHIGCDNTRDNEGSQAKPKSKNSLKSIPS